MIIRHLLLGLTGLWIVGTAGVVTSYYTPQRVMVDVTNDFGVCVLQLLASQEENVAFSPYGLVSVALVLYEGSTGPSAAEIHNTLKLPWDREVTRVGFRDLHRYLKSYFSNDGFLRGLVLSKPNILLRTNYTDLLQFYGFDIRTNTPQVPSMEPPVFTTAPPKTSPPSVGTTKQLTTTNPPPTTTLPPDVIKTRPTQGRTATSKRMTPPPTTVSSTQETTRLTRTTSQVLTTIPTMPAIPRQTTTLPSTIRITTPSQPTTTASSRSASTRAETPTTSQPPTSTQARITTQIPTTTRVPTTTQVPTTTRVPTTTQVTTTTQVPTTIRASTTTQASTPPTTMATRSTESTRAETLDVITLTNKVPNTPEIMSQMNGSMDATINPRTNDVENREGAADIDVPPDKNPPGTSQGTTPIPAGETAQTSVTSEQTTFFENDNFELSVAEITVTKSESTDNPNFTPSQASADGEITMAHVPSTQESNVPPVTLIIETTTIPQDIDDNAVMSSETVKSIATVSLPESATVLSSTNDLDSAAESAQDQQIDEKSTATHKDESTTVYSTQTKEDAEQSTAPMSADPTESPQAAAEPPELMIGAASESKIASLAAYARQQRSLFSTYKTQEQQQSGSNWVPHYHDQRWGYNPTNEFWFFAYGGGDTVPAHTYTAYLPFAFVPELSSLALQLPLDDPRYSILIVLPEERFGLSQLLYALQWCPVRAILTHLKMTAVYAILPAFTIVKHVNLVHHLAKMGIHSIFDPFRADFSPMTSEPHLFVRTIEQVVTVSLRKYFMSNRQFEPSPNEIQQHFVANHPFVYFVIDKETDVTLMTGTIVNPAQHSRTT